MLDPGFSKGWGTKRKRFGCQVIILFNFPPKLYENEKKNGWRWGRASLASRLDPPMDSVYFIKQLTHTMERSRNPLLDLLDLTQMCRQKWENITFFPQISSRHHLHHVQWPTILGNLRTRGSLSIVHLLIKFKEIETVQIGNETWRGQSHCTSERLRYALFTLIDSRSDCDTPTQETRTITFDNRTRFRAVNYALWLIHINRHRHHQWRIQHFPRGTPTPEGRPNYYLVNFLPKTAWQWRHFGPGAQDMQPLDLPLTMSNALYGKDKSKDFCTKTKMNGISILESVSMNGPLGFNWQNQYWEFPINNCGIINLTEAIQKGRTRLLNMSYVENHYQKICHTERLYEETLCNRKHTWQKFLKPINA